MSGDLLLEVAVDHSTHIFVWRIALDVVASLVTFLVVRDVIYDDGQSGCRAQKYSDDTWGERSDRQTIPG